MGPVDILIILAIVLAAGFAVRRIYLNHKNGSACPYCDGGSAACEGCQNRKKSIDKT
ncbi:MAG: FeoB-associated Cys-rich membrane protein [Firmicutes bacterium]|nr:FeoB-associated Cys-rich membrane protein [Bacillota bacterium]